MDPEVRDAIANVLVFAVTTAVVLLATAAILAIVYKAWIEWRKHRTPRR